MSFAAVNWAWEQRGLTAHQKLVLLALANRHNPDVGCFPSLGKIAEDVEFSKSTVQRAIQGLQERSLIRVQHSHRENGSQTSNRYFLAFEEGLSETTPHSQSDYPPVSERLPLKQVRDKHVRIEDNNNRVAFLDQLFEELWSSYPRKVAKAAARKSFKSACKKHRDPKFIVERAMAFSESVRGKEMQFIPHLSTWLNKERWNDELHVEQPQTTSARLQQLFDGANKAMQLEKSNEV